MPTVEQVSRGGPSSYQRQERDHFHNVEKPNDDHALPVVLMVGINYGAGQVVRTAEKAADFIREYPTPEATIAARKEEILNWVRSWLYIEAVDDKHDHQQGPSDQVPAHGAASADPVEPAVVGAG